MEFLQRTRGIRCVGSIRLSSELILTRTYCDKKSIYQSTTTCHAIPSLKSDMAGVSHGHSNVHYVMVFSQVFPVCLIGLCLRFPPMTMILTTSPAFISLGADLQLTLTSSWGLPPIGWTLHSQFLKYPLPLLRKAGHSFYILSLADSTKVGCLVREWPICRPSGVLVFWWQVSSTPCGKR